MPVDTSYLPPGVTTQTNYENPVSGGLDAIKLPVIVGEGSETLVASDLAVVRGSSSSVDQRVANEDETTRAVISVSASGAVTLGAFDGILDKIQVKHYPITNGDGTGKVSTNRTDVSVTINNNPVVVRSVSGSNGIVQLAQAPQLGDTVLVTYFMKRTDTQVSDDVSAQVADRFAIVRAVSGISDSAVGGTDVLNVYADVVSPDGQILVPNNNVLSLVVDGVDRTVVIPPKSDYTITQLASAISAASVGTLSAFVFTNNYNKSALGLSATYSLSVKSGSANGIVGLITGSADNRVSTFYVFNGPIVDGSNGGITTTDPSHVQVKVDNQIVVPTFVDGSTRAVTLPRAPKAGAKVVITYYWNTWQDTWDFLQHPNIQSIESCGDVPGGREYTQGADFVLKDDKVHWGTATTVASGVTSTGYTPLDGNQISSNLLDNQFYFAECSPSVRQSGGVATESKTEFVLPLSPTLGNGRNTPLGQSLFQTVANGRIDLPVNRPDVVWAYFGYDVNDAISRGRVSVLKVEGSVITLATPVPTDCKVYATSYYNTVTDGDYRISVVNPGASGTGTYSVLSPDGTPYLVPTFSDTSKGSSLNGIQLEFPSGSEMVSDVRLGSPFESGQFTGPVSETVTVQFASREKSPGRFTFPGSGPYDLIPGSSDRLSLSLHGTTLNAAGVPLSSPSGVTTHVGGFFGSLVSKEIVYEGSSSVAPGLGYELSGDQLTLSIDGVDVLVKTNSSDTATIADFVSAINDAASGHSDTAADGSVDTIELHADASDIDDFYVGWTVVIGNGAATATPGQVRTVVAYSGSTKVATVDSSWAGGAVEEDDPYHIYNPATRSVMHGTTRFNSATVTASNKFDKLRFVYTGDVNGATSVLIADIADTTHDSAATLATAVQTAMNSAISGAGAGFAGLGVAVTANGDGQLEFALQLPGTDASGYLQFVAHTTPAYDFAILAGLDTASAAGGGQAVLVQGPVAYAKVCTGGDRLYDRLVIRNRVLPGGAGNLSPASLINPTAVIVKSNSVHAGVSTGDFAPSGSSATVRPATLAAAIGFAFGQDSSTAQPQVVFYDGTSLRPANNVLTFELDGHAVNVQFTASETGTATNLGPATGTSNGSVIDQIIDAVAAVAGAPFGNASAVLSAKLIRQEGAGFRITSSQTSTSSRIAITGGSALSVLGLSVGLTALRTQPTADTLASALMSHASTSMSSWVTDPSSTSSNHFANYGVASVAVDAAGARYLYVQDLPSSSSGLGTSSTVTVLATSGGVADATRLFTGLGATPGDGGVGDNAVSGFFVKSSVPGGSGSANVSMLSSDGTGQDGVVGQTYVDLVTGLTFTVLPRGWSSDKIGPWTAYPTGSNSTFRFVVGTVVTTDSNIPVNAIPGVELTVSNTYGTNVDDYAVVSTFKRSGNEPRVGDLYYVTYVYKKADFGVVYYSKLSSIEAAYGPIHPDNPVSLAAYLAILNGAAIVGIKQVEKAEDSEQASLESYRNAIDSLARALPGQIRPDVITLLRGDNVDLFAYLKRHCSLQSSPRFKSERTSILGFASGTNPAIASSWAKSLSHVRVRLVYPDMAVVTIGNQQGGTSEFLVDGFYVAAALSGSVVSPNYDVASPWTNRKLAGFAQLGRQLDDPTNDFVAQSGVTVMVDQSPAIKVRHGLTTDMSDWKFKLPTVCMIADEIQRQGRIVTDPFIGSKFLPGLIPQIENRISAMLKDNVAAQIIVSFAGVRGTTSVDDPTAVDLEAAYAPVKPFLYLRLTFNLRSSTT